jgi:hypothetical protein
VTRWGAALPGARAPRWTFELSGTGLGLANAQKLPDSDLAATGISGVRGTMRAACVAEGHGIQIAAVAGIAGATRPFQATNELPTDNRRQYVHKTRVNADGGGASGPEPEREQALHQGQPDPLQAADPHTGSAA